MTKELPGIHKRWIVTAYNEEGQAYRYMADNEPDAQKTSDIFSDMNLSRVSVRSVLWDNRKGVIV